MRVLIIHPKDETTDFLCDIYHKDYTIIRHPEHVPQSTLKNLMRNHNLVIMMGHGDEKGLFGKQGYIIDTDYIDILRNKKCIYIWCYASDFVKKYGLKTPFSTGMFISETEEAYLMGVKHEKGDIIKSNTDFCCYFKSFLDSLILENDNQFDRLKKTYGRDTSNNISQYNANLFYENI